MTACITAIITFYATNYICSRNATTSKVVRFEEGNATSRAYPVANARMDIDTMQAIATRIYDLLGPNIDSTLSAPDSAHIGLGVVAYTINAVDLMAALNVTVPNCASCVPTPQFPAIRVYLGLNYSSGFKLFVVPVTRNDPKICDRCGSDMFFDTVGGIHVDPVVGQGNFVMDLIAPCPSVCDPHSQLVQDSLTKSKVSCKCEESAGN